MERLDVILFSLANSLRPGSIKKINTMNSPFKHMENINFFLKFVEEEAKIPKTESFMTVDLFEKQDPNSVLVCLSSLARKVGRKHAREHRRHRLYVGVLSGYWISGSNSG